jgi:hypothetical protein
MSEHHIPFGGSGMVKECYEWITDNIEEGKTILEIGAGRVSTYYLSRKWNLYSIETDKQWVDWYKEANYIYCAEENEKEYMDCIQMQLPPDYDLLIIDGYLFDSRDKVIKYHEMFRIKDIPVIVDDTYRQDGDQIANWICEKYDKEVVHIIKDGANEQSRVLI